MAVHLTRIYTRAGDAGQTRLGNNEVAGKTDPRIVAYAAIRRSVFAATSLLPRRVSPASPVRV